MQTTIDEIKTTSWIFRAWSHPVGVRRTQLHASCVISSIPKDPLKCRVEILHIKENTLSMREVKNLIEREVNRLGFITHASDRDYNAQKRKIIED